MSKPEDRSGEPTVAHDGDPAQHALPERIGNYRIRRCIASGGMGTVYEALQEKPRRSVAVKVMRAGGYSESGLRRFAYEAQILARLRHPGVAQIYEAGSYREGDREFPFFAMEYIPSARLITEHVRDRGLGTREILELFIQVCDAVHHGHQRGIVHRDLKPGNILVDSAGRPKIIDFGVARAMDADMAPAAEQTQVGQFVGTPQYMSPEQFTLDSGDVDTRSDIYALGVVLYELLSSRLPYDVRGSKLHEIPTIVGESEPPRLGSLDSSLRGDLETIVSCALEKDRERRYQSAHGLGRDLRRYLSGEAISAQPPTLGYQLRVLVRRNKIWISAAAVALVVLIGSSVFSTAMYVQAEAARARAELHALQSKNAIEFVAETMRESWPEGWGHEPSITDLLQRIRTKVDVAFADQPLVAAEIHSTLAWASLPQEDFENFENHCQVALDLRRDNLAAGDPLTLESLHDLARAQSIRGRNEELVRTSEEIVAFMRAAYGPAAQETLDARDYLVTAFELDGRYGEANELAQKNLSVAVETFGESDELSIDLMAHAAYVQLALDEGDGACTLAARAQELSGPRVGDATADYARSVLAACRIMQGDVDAAASLYEQVLPRDPGIVKAYQGFAGVADEGAALVVMWETWCPFSQRVIPVVEELHRRYGEGGLRIAGLTRVTRSSSDERVELFIRERGLSFPILKDSGKSWSYFGATGTPFAVLLLDGRVVWKSSVGNAAELSGGLVRALVEGAAG